MVIKKLRLDLDALAVESFEVFSPAEGRGTVKGRATGLRGSACTDCGECGGGGFDPDTGGGTETDPGPVESMMDYSTCGGQFSCERYGWCG